MTEATTQMSTLPQIAPARSSTSSPRTKVRVYETYPPRLPSAPDIPQRINPLCPPAPQRRTVALETIQPHWQNEQRSNRMKQRDHHRYHNAWSKFYYGSVPEQEQYRHYVRSVLKQQMSDKWSGERQAAVDKIDESTKAVAYDQKCRDEDAAAFKKKFTYLKNFTNENKRLMEYHWSDRKSSKYSTDKYDREQLKYNPINWSCTLK